MKTQSIDVASLDKRLSGGGKVTLIDVRRKTDYEASPGKIPGAIWRDPEKIERWGNKLPAGKPVVVYCAKGGSVSQSAADRLRGEGRDVLHLEGGLKAWTEAGKATEENQPNNFHQMIQTSDIDLLRKAGVPADDIAHSVKVAEKALEIASRTNHVLDFELIGRGALFHDLGKAKTHEIEHGRIGAEMGTALGLPDDITAIMEKHIRGGLSGEEAIELNLPVKDYTLRTLEERIIIYADRLVDIITEDIVETKDEMKAEENFEEILRTHIKYGKNEKTLARYLEYHREIQDLMRKE